MFGVLGMDAAFLRAACSHKKEPVGIIQMKGNSADPVIKKISCIGKLVVNSTKNGEPTKEVYNDLNDTSISIQSDANSLIILEGNVTSLTAIEMGSGFHMDEITLIDCESLNVLDLSSTYIETLDLAGAPFVRNLKLSRTPIIDVDFTSTQLLSVSIESCESLTSADFSKCPNIETIYMSGCSALNKLNLKNNSVLSSLIFNEYGGPTAITLIYYAATNNSVSSKIAEAITNATAADGTVYTDSQGAYYSTIADAATAKGWTIEQL